MTAMEVARPKGNFVYRGSLISIEQVELVDSAGKTQMRDIVRHPGAVVVVPVLPDGSLVIIRNFRIAVGEWLEEFCAGKLEPGENPLQAASRELEEETGYRGGRVEPLGSFYSSPGFTDELMQVFVATELTQVGQRLEPDERIEVAIRTPSQMQTSIQNGGIRDAKTIAAFQLWSSKS
ncbi:MAG: NUDIX hydrolase [Phycisphaerales bacterium]|nr:NUDIX hydrolase [Phycisphaerales bacterium]